MRIIATCSRMPWSTHGTHPGADPQTVDERLVVADAVRLLRGVAGTQQPPPPPQWLMVDFCSFS